MVKYNYLAMDIINTGEEDGERQNIINKGIRLMGSVMPVIRLKSWRREIRQQWLYMENEWKEGPEKQNKYGKPPITNIAKA